MRKTLFFLFITFFTEGITYTSDYYNLYSIHNVMEEADEDEEEIFVENLTETQIQQNPYPLA
jgi:hypothetical protein